MLHVENIVAPHHTHNPLTLNDSPWSNNGQGIGTITHQIHSAARAGRMSENAVCWRANIAVHHYDVVGTAAVRDMSVEMFCLCHEFA